MVICPQCQFANPKGMDVCLQCGQRHGVGQNQDTGYGQADVSEYTPIPEVSVAETPPAVVPAGSVVDGTDMAMPALGQAQASALTIRNRGTGSRPNLTPPPELIQPASVLESGVTKVSSRHTKKTSSGVQTLEPVRPVAAPSTVFNNEVAAAKPPEPIKPSVTPKLLVLRGEKLNTTFPIYEGKNVVGRFADKPVDVDLEGQESVERIRVSRHHAIIHFDTAKSELRIEDLNSLNGTWVNNVKIHSGHQRRLLANDVIQIGTVQMKVLIETTG